MFYSKFSETALEIEKPKRKRMGPQRNGDGGEILHKKEGVPGTEK